MKALMLAQALTWHDGLVVIVTLIVLAIAAYLMSYLDTSKAVVKLAYAGLAIIAGLVIINLLLILIDHPIIRW